MFTRYALGRPIVWVEESATYAFIWMAFVGASLGLKHGAPHPDRDLRRQAAAARGAALRAAVWLLVLAMLAVLMVQGLKVMGVEGRSRTISLPVELPRSLSTRCR